MGVKFLVMGTILSRRLRICRHDLSLQQDDLAERSGVSRSYISDIERSKIQNVGVEVVDALAKALGVNAAYLIGWSEETGGDSPHVREGDSLRARELLDIFDGLGEYDQTSLLRIAKALRNAYIPEQQQESFNN